MSTKESFRAELKALMDKYGCKLEVSPAYTPDGLGGQVYEFVSRCETWEIDLEELVED